MNKKLKFTLTTIWILLSRSYDAYCTYLLTPDLNEEANPLVSVIGVSSWTTLLVILSLLTLYVLYVYYISMFTPLNLAPKEKGYSFSNFIAYTYLGKKSHWTSVFYNIPISITRLNNYFGQMLSKFLIYAGIISTIMWLLINYTEFYKTIHNVTVIYTILIGGCLIIAYKWNKSLYKEYLSN
ncbi:MAG: hypothetical protein N4A35_05510 [Flavobacteriales bacterium]|jgi:hypothetical protein|nr:hypothetical protein [Flavobacteriales bacterium]